MPPNLIEFPSELVQQIFENLPRQTLPTIRLVCRRFDELHRCLNWRRLCREHFRYWNADRGIESALCDRKSNLNWQRQFVERQRVERVTTDLLDDVLGAQLGRMQKIQKIVELGYDAKDTLLHHFAVADDAPDVLARRYEIQ